MTENRWNADRFAHDLTGKLTAALTEVRNAASLALAVTKCAAAAESACSGRQLACTAGCPHCCVLNVAILLPEGMAIADWIRERLSPSELDAVKERLEVHRSWARWMDDEERIVKKASCPFLDAAGRCLIHPVRPLACRGVASLDSKSCQEAFIPIYTDEERTVLADLVRKAAYDTGFSALAQALRFHGLDDRSIELGCGVMAFLEHPEYRELVLSGGRLPHWLWEFSVTALRISDIP